MLEDQLGSLADEIVSFDAWTKNRSVASLGTNAGSDILPFQTWQHFKEAFAPELVAQAIAGSRNTVRACIDPFGGSGTTALACQFLGVHPITIEVNPYLADVIEAKLSSHDPTKLRQTLEQILLVSMSSTVDLREAGLPGTFVEAASKSKWIFNRIVARKLLSLLRSIDVVANARERKFFRAMLGGMLVEVSNVVINGKGRRYRRGWEDRVFTARQIAQKFHSRSMRAIEEVEIYRSRREKGFKLYRGDCIQKLKSIEMAADLAVFSPPYPNSFDYTDVYNVELWMLGYIKGPKDNHQLRKSTLSSHVQIKREFSLAPGGSNLLDSAVNALREVRESLWSPWIPEMVGAYFSDMRSVLEGLSLRLRTGAEAWMVVGDSRYAGVHVPTGEILAELAPSVGYSVVEVRAFRSMRSSAQQGGKEELREDLVVLRKNGKARR